MTKENQPPRFLNARDVAQIMEISEASAYRKIRALNDELKKMGKLVTPGKVPRRFFEEKTYL